MFFSNRELVGSLQPHVATTRFQSFRLLLVLSLGIIDPFLASSFTFTRVSVTGKLESRFRQVHFRILATPGRGIRLRFNEKYDYDLKQTTLHGLDPTTTQRPLETDYIAATKGAG